MNNTSKQVQSRTFIIRGLLIIALCTLAACSKTTEEEYFNKAKAALAASDNPTAIIEMKNALKLNGANAEIRWLLGTTYLAQGDGASAEKELRSALQFGVDQQSTLLPLARAYNMQQKHEELIKLKVPKPLVAEVKAQLFALKGRSYLSISDPLSAAKIIKRAEDLAPRHPVIVTATAALKTAQGNYDEARRLLTDMLVSNPSYSPAWQQLAQLEQQQGNFDAALKAHTRVIEQETNNSSDLTQRALVYIQLNRIDDAKKDLSQVQKGGKQALLFGYATGLIAVYEERYSDAKKALQSVLNSRPDYMPAVFHLGLIAYQRGDMEQALTLLSTFQRTHPNSTAANKLLAGVYLALGDKDSATSYLHKTLTSEPDEIESMKLLGQLSLEKGESAEAIAYFSQLVAKEAGNSESYILLGRSYSAAKQPNAAREEYKRAIALNPDLATAEIGIITSYINDNEFKLALDYVHKLEKERPSDTDLPVYESAIHLALGDRQVARKVLQDALALTPGHPTLSHNLANLALLESDFDTARELYLDAIEHDPKDIWSIMHLAKLELISGNEQKAVSLVENALEIDPASLDVRSTLATYHLKKGHPKKAMQLVKEVEEQYSDTPAFLEILTNIAIELEQYQQAKQSVFRLLELEPQSAEAHVLLAKVNARLADGDTVINDLLEAIRLNPRHFEARLTLARIYASNNAFEQSDEILDSLSGIYSSHPQVLYLMGLRELRKDNPESAYELFSEAENTERHGDYIIAMAKAQFRSDNPDDAIKTLKKRVKSNPKDINVQYYLANTLLLLKRNNEAIIEFRKVLLIEPKSTGALNNLAWLLKDKSPDEAETLINTALELTPNLPQALHTLAEIKLSQNKPGESVELLNKALTSSPNDIQLQYSLAKALEKNGQRKKAKTLYEKLLSKERLPLELKTDIETALTRATNS